MSCYCCYYYCYCYCCYYYCCYYYYRPGVGSPVVGSVDGDHHYDSRKHVLEWCLPVIDANNSTGTIEFSIPARPDDFFPVKVSFSSPKTYTHIGVS